MTTYGSFDQIAKSGAGFEPVGFAEMLAKLLDALIKGHILNAILVEHVQKVLQLVRVR